jgi:hypothetical protein
LRYEVRNVERCGEEDASFGVARIHVGHGQPLLVGQRIPWVESRAPTRGQSIPIGRAGSTLGHPLGVSEGDQTTHVLQGPRVPAPRIQLQARPMVARDIAHSLHIPSG